jgi:hypothetical protein
MSVLEFTASYIVVYCASAVISAMLYAIIVLLVLAVCWVAKFMIGEAGMAVIRYMLGKR